MAIFGWCLDNHHANCLKQIPDYQCTCQCHYELIKGETK